MGEGAWRSVDASWTHAWLPHCEHPLHPIQEVTPPFKYMCVSTPLTSPPVSTHPISSTLFLDTDVGCRLISHNPLRLGCGMAPGPPAFTVSSPSDVVEVVVDNLSDQVQVLHMHG